MKNNGYLALFINCLLIIQLQAQDKIDTMPVLFENIIKGSPLPKIQFNSFKNGSIQSYNLYNPSIYVRFLEKDSILMVYDNQQWVEMKGEIKISKLIIDNCVRIDTCGSVFYRFDTSSINESGGASEKIYEIGKGLVSMKGPYGFYYNPVYYSKDSIVIKLLSY